MRLQEAGVQLYKMVGGKKKHCNRHQDQIINVKDCLFNYYDFKRPEFIAVLEWFSKQRITENERCILRC